MRPPAQTSRIPASLSRSLHHRLNLYALAATAAGVGALALAQPAQAEIVYTPAHKKLHLNHNFFLDLNHDGVNDFKFFMKAGETYSSHGCTAKMFLYRVNRGKRSGRQDIKWRFFRFGPEGGRSYRKEPVFPEPVGGTYGGGERILR